MCTKQLANPVIETYRSEITELCPISGRGATAPPYWCSTKLVSKGRGSDLSWERGPLARLPHHFGGVVARVMR